MRVRVEIPLAVDPTPLNFPRSSKARASLLSSSSRSLPQPPPTPLLFYNRMVKEPAIRDYTNWLVSHVPDYSTRALSFADALVLLARL